MGFSDFSRGGSVSNTSSSPCFSNNSLMASSDDATCTLLDDPGAASSSSCCSSTELDLQQLDHLVEETYTSSLFQTEPLYQFYDKELGSLVGGGGKRERRLMKQVRETKTA